MPKIDKLRPSKRYVVAIIVLLLALYVIVPQLGDFKDSWSLLKNPDPGWVMAALGFTSLTYLAGAMTYCLLAFSSLRYTRTVLIQLAAMFVNRLLPAGVGAMGANYLYLRRNKHSVAQATTVVGLNNILGGLGHNLLFWVIIIATGYSSLQSNESTGTERIYLYGGVALVAGLGLAYIFGRRKFKKILIDIKNQILDYRHRPQKLLLALSSSMILTICNVLGLYACAMALGIELSFASIFLVFTLGVGAGAATPTPGGLGGFEAGLVAGFIAYGIDSSIALAVALLYRLISYWLTLIVGAIALVVSRRLNYI